MEEIKKTNAQLRKEVYAYLADNGLEVPPNVQGGLSKLLKSVYDHRVVETTTAQEPLTHVLECPKCLGVVVVKGKSGKLRVQWRRRAKQFVDKSNV